MNGSPLVEITPARHAELLRAERVLKWLNGQQFLMVRTVDMTLRLSVRSNDEIYKGPTVAAVVELAMAAEAAREGVAEA